MSFPSPTPPDKSQVKKPGTKTFHKGSVPPTLMKEQVGQYYWAPFDEKRQAWKLRNKDNDPDLGRVSTHDSSAFIAALPRTIVEDPSGTLSTP